METSEQELRKKKTSYVTVIVLICICLVLQLAGLIAPGWLVLDFGSTGSLSLGLFYMIECSENSCTVKTIDGEDSFNGGLVEYRSETIVALAKLLIALAVTVRLHYAPVTEKAQWLINHVTLVLSLGLSASLAIAASVKWARDIVENNSAGTIKPPYALIMTGIGGVFALALFAILLEITYVQYNWRYAAKSKQHRLPVSHSYLIPGSQLAPVGDTTPVQSVTTEQRPYASFQRQTSVDIQPELHRDSAVQDQPSVKNKFEQYKL